MFDETPPDPTLTSRVAALEAQLAALGATVASNAGAADDAVAEVASDRVAGDAAALAALTLENEGRQQQLENINDQLGAEIQTRADQIEQLQDQVASLGVISSEVAAEAGAAAGAEAGKVAGIRAVYGTGYRFDNVLSVGQAAQTLLPADASRARMAVRVKTFGGRAIVNLKGRGPSLYDADSRILSYSDGLLELVGAECPLGAITVVSLGGEIEIFVSITNTTGYDPATAAMLARFPIQPTEQRRALIQDRYSALSSAGIMATADWNGMHAGADVGAALCNWAGASASQIVNTVPFSADRGFTGGAGYIRTGVLLPAARYGINNARMFLWISDTLIQNNTFTMGWGAGAIQPNRSTSNGGSAWMRPNVNSNKVVTTGGIGGFFGWTRDNPDTFTIYWYDPVLDDLVVHQDAVLSETAFQRELLLLCNNGALGANSLCSHEIMASDAGSFITQTQVETMLSADLDYFRGVGAHA